MQVYQRGKGKWTVRWREGGRQREQRGFTTRTEAQDWLDTRIKPRIRRGLPGVRRQHELIDLVRAWWDGYVEDNVTPATRETYRADIRLAMDTLGATRNIHTLTRADIADMARALLDEGRSDRKVNKTLTALGSCFRYGVQHGIVEENIVRGVSRRPEQRGIIKIPDAADLAALRATAPSPRDLLMIDIASLAGLRQSELLGLEWRHIENRAIIVEQVMDLRATIRATTKTMHARRVPIPKRLHDALEAYRTADDGLIFTNNGKRLHRVTWSRDVWRPWKRGVVWERAELGGDWQRMNDLQWKQWRHYAISKWAAAGAKPLQCSRWAGHTSFRITMDRYGFLFDEDELDVMERL